MNPLEERIADLEAELMKLRAAAQAVVYDARDQGRDDCMDDLVDEEHIERLRAALDRSNDR